MFVAEWHKDKNDEMDETATIIHKIKKLVRPSIIKSPIQNCLFSKNFVSNCIKRLRQCTQDHNRLHENLVSELQSFIRSNKVVIKQSDKNAGICVMFKADYDNEVIRQLNDSNTYRPSTYTEFDLSMHDFEDRVRHLNRWILKSLKLKSIVPANRKPAKFYILPKVHKKFENFPPGRPISSTISCINKGVAMLLDKVLQPLSLFIPNLIIDTPHLLLLLNNLKLKSNRKYMLVTADINAMYLELPINVCKNHCMTFFNRYKQIAEFPFQISSQELKTLLDLSLDYSFTEYNREIYFQHKGIQMGNSASVSVANITAAMELENLVSNLIEFIGRFIDDIFLVIDITDLETDIESWLNSFFDHSFLKFSYEFSTSNVNFLDLNIALNENNEIVTSLFRKPMSKHEFLHYSSNHPRHLLNSLPYSCGLRVIRSCTHVQDSERELKNLFHKFQLRGYPYKILKNAANTLNSKERTELLKPKSKILIKHLSIHNPSILEAYNICQFNNSISNNKVFIVIPFFNNIRGLGRITREMFVSELIKCRSKVFRKCILDMNICIAFSLSNSVQKYISCVNIEASKC